MPHVTPAVTGVLVGTEFIAYHLEQSLQLTSDISGSPRVRASTPQAYHRVQITSMLLQNKVTHPARADTHGDHAAGEWLRL
jgi:hypothetical protein